MNITLKRSEHNSFDGEARYYHNNLDINDWKKNLKVDSVQKIALRLCELYLLNANQDNNTPINERVYIQNTALMSEKKDGIVLYKYERNTVQYALRHLTELGIITKMIYEDPDGNQFDWSGGTKEEWNKSNAGLTKRFIVLDIAKAKLLFTVTHNSKEFATSEARSRTRRFIYRRPFSLKDFSKELTNQQVADVRARKGTGYNAYLKIQLKKFGIFNTKELVIIGTDHTSVSVVGDDVKTFIINYLTGLPDTVSKN